MIKFVVKIGDEELPYEFQEFWQFAFLVRFLNWYLSLAEGGLTKRALDATPRCECGLPLDRDGKCPARY